ncbi:MAG: hypothetical protein KGS72_28755 [Cyanobacteria bacterium REEB67]|nr:hypothetical protein [Cyanobacteria bacterium REEB67]
MFGAEASIEGNDQSAVLFNEKPIQWLEAKKLAHLGKEQEQLMHRHYKQWMEDLGKEFGFKTLVDIAADGNSSRITFTRK